MSDTEPRDRRTLESWKEIADYFGRSVRTVQRWDLTEGLPVRRKMHTTRASVFAYKDELQAWWDSQPADSAVRTEEQPRGAPAETLEASSRQPKKRRLIVLGTFAFLILLGVMIWIGRSPDIRFEAVIPSTRLLARATCEGCRMDRIAVGRSPVAAAMTPDGRETYVVNYEDSSVSVIETASGRVSHTIAVTKSPDNITVAPDGREVYIGGRSDVLAVIDTRRKQVRQVPIGGPVRDIAVTPNGKRVYLALDYAGLKWYSPADRRVTTIPTTHCPHALALDPIRSQLWISYRCGGPGGTAGFDSIDVLDLASERSVGTVTGLPRVGGSTVISPSGAYIWADGWDRCIGPNYNHADCPASRAGIVHVLRASDRLLVQTLSFQPLMQANLVFSPAGDRVFLTQCLRFAAVDTASFHERESAEFRAGRFTMHGGMAYVPLSDKNEVGILSFSPAECEPPSERLAHFWPGDGVSSDLVQGRNVKSDGLKFAPGRVGQAFRFDGKGPGADVALNNALFDPLNPPDFQQTVALWFKLGSPGTEQNLLATGLKGSGLRLSVDHEGNLRFQLGEMSMISRALVAPNRWYHVTVRQTRNLFELFINGERAATAARVRKTNSRDKVLHVGWEGPMHPVMNGLLDEIVYYDRALSDNEIRKLVSMPVCVSD